MKTVNAMTSVEWLAREMKRTRMVPRRVPGQMNRTEKAYAGVLEMLRKNDLIRGWRFEEVTLKLGPDCRYTPDFMVERNDQIEFHEVKGFRRDDAMVKLRAAVKQFPCFKFFLVWDGERRGTFHTSRVHYIEALG